MEGKVIGKIVETLDEQEMNRLNIFNLAVLRQQNAITITAFTDELFFLRFSGWQIRADLPQ